MTYRIKLFSSFSRPYYFHGDEQTVCIQRTTDEYEAPNIKLAIQIIKDFMDPPETELTLEQVEREFSDKSSPVPEMNLVAIREYYNGRLAMYRKIMTDLDSTEFPVILKYDIPYKYNHFSVDLEDPLEKQLDAYLEIEIME